MICPDCEFGEVGMQRDGQPIVCPTCDGKGILPPLGEAFDNDGDTWMDNTTRGQRVRQVYTEAREAKRAARRMGRHLTEREEEELARMREARDKRYVLGKLTKARGGRR